MTDRTNEPCPVCNSVNTQGNVRYGAPWIVDLHCCECGYDEETISIEEGERLFDEGKSND